MKFWCLKKKKIKGLKRKFFFLLYKIKFFCFKETVRKIKANCTEYNKQFNYAVCFNNYYSFSSHFFFKE